MRKKATLVLSAVLALSVASTVYAHLTGAFADFLVTVNDESTTAKLKQEVANTKQQISELTPRIEKMKSQYEGNRQVAVDKLQFYSEMGLDTWLSLLLQESSPADVMGSQWLIERNLDAYMRDLDQLYLEYKQLVTTKETLAGHERLLAVIEENLAARGAFLADNPELPLDQLANYLDIDWMSEVEPKLLAFLEEDRSLTEQHMREWAMSAQEGYGHKLPETWLNERSQLKYFFRSDHVYTVFQKPDLHVILIGQVLKAQDGVATLTYEAGFFNGFLMPSTLIEELKGFRIPTEQLQLLPGVQKDIHVQQSSGALLLQKP
ncbi:hypothetical protein EDM59_26090 [Brevibacillus nitrificans]|uniref:SbsC C-terminal domain-containing protein n=1 Tax=Brevibacillus nitrificans TaxID=651560 RepID=A0A3M8CXA7_9BACL|nr:hypothetical protein [Brevibacillus nitrificans]RNB79877.1 hypothetical protein EDM59_26090 [Brevibacillus nitrificans]